MMNKPLSRRSFLQTTAAGAAAAFAAPAIVSAETLKSELHVASVGAKNMACADLSNVATHPKV